MPRHTVEQLLHGYRRGHERLAGSVKLPVRDSELITRLSDLSGSLSGAPRFASYLTVYPLPSGTYFALGRTWPDPDAPRAGCVMTHTLLVPVELWETMAEPQALDRLFALPSSREVADYNSAVVIPKSDTPRGSFAPDRDYSLTFVHRYFGEGRRPVVWFGWRDAEGLLWRILRGLWPKLRATFSACTFCLQPRTLEDRAFEVMFAPVSAYPRFRKIGAEHLIGFDADHIAGQIEPWCEVLANKLFGPTGTRLMLGDASLWAELDEDPSAVRRFLLLDGLIKDSNAAPQALVGAMDLVESVARGCGSAVAAKQRVARRAVRAARQDRDPASGLESLGLIEDRLRRASFSRVVEAVGPELLEAVAIHTRNFPEIAVQSSALLASGENLEQSWFGRGLLQGLQRLAQDDPDELLLVRSTPAVVERILVDYDVGLIFVGSALARRDKPEVRSDLLGWLSGLRDHQYRSNLRAEIVPKLGSDDMDILTELLKDLRAEEVRLMLDTIWQQTLGFESGAVREVIIGEIARGHPMETRAWTHQQASEWRPVVAQVFAATYSPTREGLLELLEGTEAEDKSRRGEAIAAFLAALGPGRYPYWLLNFTRDEISILSSLLCAAADASVGTTEQTRKLIREVVDLPPTRLPSILPLVLESSQRSFFPALVDLTMRNLVAGYLGGTIEGEVAQAFQEEGLVVPWFTKIDPGELKSLVSHSARLSVQHWSNAWRWAATAPQALYAREPTLLPSLIEELWHVRYWEWPQEAADKWAVILRRSLAGSGSYRAGLMLSVQALKLSFANNALPLSSVVVEAFYPVYSAATLRTAPRELDPLFGIWDWDKAKKLRQDLVDCFLSSGWPPGDLPFATADFALLRKIFKRLLRRHQGKRYAWSVLADLEGRTGESAVAYARAFKEMLAAPDFYEEWD